jgi:uncharacterized membrane protein YebE (DUF533 family)
VINFKTGIAALIVSALPALALAQATPTTPNIDKREARQEQRIQQGAKSGELTPREAARLEKGQARVQRMETKAKSDGTVTAQERKRIQREQSQQSKRIARQKHDRQR